MTAKNSVRIVSLIFIVLFTYSQNTFSQSVLLGLKGGISIPNLKGGGTPQSEGYTSRLAPNFGLFANIPFTSNFSLQGEILFSGQGGKREGMQPINGGMDELPIPAGLDLYANFDNETIINYLEFPVLARYSFIGTDKGFDFYIEGGAYLGILLNATVHTEGESLIYLDSEGNVPIQIGGYPLPAQNFENETDIVDKLNDANFGITGGVGSTYNFSGQQLSLELKGAYGFIPIQGDEKNGANHTGALYFTLGYGIKL